jgi:hypothetical protein
MVVVNLYCTKQMNISTDAYRCFARCWIDYHADVLDKYGMTSLEIWSVVARVWSDLPHDEVSYWF